MIEPQPSEYESAAAMDRPNVDDRLTDDARELTCPRCGYSLYGLGGSVVQCPECGTLCNVARLIAAQWRKPWYKAPGFNALLWPSACAMMGAAVLLLGYGLAMVHYPLASAELTAFLAAPAIVMGL